VTLKFSLYTLHCLSLAALSICDLLSLSAMFVPSMATGRTDGAEFDVPFAGAELCPTFLSPEFEEIKCDIAPGELVVCGTDACRVRFLMKDVVVA